MALYEPRAAGVDGAVALRMTRLVRHRGPDGEGLVFFGLDPGLTPTRVTTEDSPAGTAGQSSPPPDWTFVLGHRRLAIIDLSIGGHQPMSDAAGDIWFTYNGEIYNYLELRTELISAGHHFTSASDTEVILAAWREWGEGCLSRFNGMFSFVLIDRRARRVFAARDRFGEKPLYYWRTPTGGVAFVSEIKQLTAHPGWRARLNGQRAYDYLNWGLTDHTAETLFADVEQVRGGEYISSPLDEVASARPQRWYEVRPAFFSGSFGEAAARFRELLDDSVRLRLRADVPVGTCLSGGLDSSSIACLVRSQLGAAAPALQNTFSAYSDVARFDERRFINDVVATIGSTAHHVIPDPQTLVAGLDRLLWHQDEPFGSTSIWAQWCVFQLARDAGVVVMLDGQGADEALGGYHGYFGPRLSGLLRRGRLIQFARESVALRKIHQASPGLQLRWLANEFIPPVVAEQLRRWTGRTVLEPAHLDLEKMGARPIAPYLGSVSLNDPVRSLSTAQLTSLSLPMLLHYADRDSMAHGLETRLPFLDQRLVEFCLGLPEEYKLEMGWTKRVLREGLRGSLPESVRLRRDKLGFATAEEVWMRTQSREVFVRLLDESIAASQGLLTESARARAHRILDGAEPFSFLVWRMINFGQWIRRFNVQL